MAVSGSLRIVGESFPKNKDQARESILNTLAHPAAPSDVSRRRQFAFAIVQAALITAGALVLMVGAAAAAGVDLSSVPRHVADTLAKPLPLSAEPLQDSRGFEPGEGGSADDSAASGRRISESGDGTSAVEDHAASGSSEVSGANDPNRPVVGSAPSQTNTPNSNRPAIDPTGNDGSPPANHPPGGENAAGHQGTAPGTTDPPGQDPGYNSQSDRDGHHDSNSPGNQGDINQHGQTDSNGNGSNGGGPKLSTGDAPNGSNGGASSGANSNASNEASTDHSLIFTLY